MEARDKWAELEDSVVVHALKGLVEENEELTGTVLEGWKHREGN